MERQLHTKMEIISVGRLVTAFSILHDSPYMHICTVSVGAPMLNEHMQTASSHPVHRSSSPFLISYIVVMTSPSSHIFKNALASTGKTSPGFHCASSLLPSVTLHPHLLEVLDDHHVGIHVAVNAVLHASILASGESAL